MARNEAKHSNDDPVRSKRYLLYLRLDLISFRLNDAVDDMEQLLVPQLIAISKQVAANPNDSQAKQRQAELVAQLLDTLSEVAGEISWIFQ